MKEKYLPIGTIVTLKGATKPIMIMGFCPMSKDKKIYDYSACTYPEGLLSAERALAFNHNQIAEINHMGMESNAQTQFNNTIKQMLNNIQELKDVTFASDSKEKEVVTPDNIVSENIIPTLDSKDDQ